MHEHTPITQTSIKKRHPNLKLRFFHCNQKDFPHL